MGLRVSSLISPSELAHQVVDQLLMALPLQLILRILWTQKMILCEFGTQVAHSSLNYRELFSYEQFRFKIWLTIILIKLQRGNPSLYSNHNSDIATSGKIFEPRLYRHYININTPWTRKDRYPDHYKRPTYQGGVHGRGRFASWKTRKTDRELYWIRSEDMENLCYPRLGLVQLTPWVMSPKF